MYKRQMDESLANEITEYLQKDIIMDFAGYEERSYSERFAREEMCIRDSRKTGQFL